MTILRTVVIDATIVGITVTMVQTFKPA